MWRARSAISRTTPVRAASPPLPRCSSSRHCCCSVIRSLTRRRATATSCDGGSSRRSTLSATSAPAWTPEHCSVGVRRFVVRRLVVGKEVVERLLNARQILVGGDESAHEIDEHRAQVPTVAQQHGGAL